MPNRVFAVNEVEWWVGEGSPEEILAAYMAFYRCSHEDATGSESDLPTPLTETEMDALKFHRDELGKPLQDPRTFREQLAHLVTKETKFPCLFATTEW